MGTWPLDGPLHPPARILAHHHLGYSVEHQLDIQWLCYSCHRHAHNRMQAIRRGTAFQDHAASYIDWGQG